MSNEGLFICAIGCVLGLALAVGAGFMGAAPVAVCGLLATLGFAILALGA